ncbi:hypothetical protein NC653_011069 [Populus alba x Populus x berolinensis]|uniref:Uncharacterized protein n=1 Tax=Populus alba x Populus x berolinensis TaxID=444605 RepID=A0AAD6R178_9ROSI|nr:hypothetical protein NC653_011069 [Populus alba x Populus x berolinensis]
MESAPLCSSLLPSFPQRRRYGRGKRSSGTVVLASRRESSQDQWLRYGELLVDESMPALRKRIHEMKMAERNYEPPEEWMEWEKQCYTSYDEFIFTMSVPASMVMISQQLMEAICGVLSTVHGG